MKTKIAIVGASIAGSVCAILLDRLGFDVTIFEKSKGNEAIADRGAGIWLPKELINTLIDKDILSKNFPSLSIQERPIYTYDANTDKEKLLTSNPIHPVTVNWMNLYADLKKHRPESKVIYSSQVTGIEGHSLIINENQRINFDYCIFADGIHSLGRRHLFSNSKPSFTKSIAWRGTLDRVDAATTKHFLGKGPFFVCEKGYLIIYLIPSKDSTKEYRINWMFYERVDAAHELFRGDDEKASQNVIKGTMTAEYRQYLHAAAKKYFSAFPREIILTTEEPFIQALHEMLIPGYVMDNICLVGDAGIVLRPHTAVGATKAIKDALALGEHLEKSSDITAALKAWNEDCYLFGKNQFELGRRLGALFVTNVPDWRKLSKQQMDGLWEMASTNCWYAN